MRIKLKPQKPGRRAKRPAPVPIPPGINLAIPPTKMIKPQRKGADRKRSAMWAAGSAFGSASGVVGGGGAWKLGPGERSSVISYEKTETNFRRFLVLLLRY